MVKIYYELYYIISENNEEYTMNFETLQKAIEFIELCTLYEITYKIYKIENGDKKLDKIFKYSTQKWFNIL
jgi:hypothetical protein